MMKTIAHQEVAELTREGFPDMDADEFWRMLERGGQVRDGKTWRIEFEAP